MFNIAQFRELIVKSTLNDLVLYSQDVEELMIFTCAVESDGGTYLRQMKGPALGIYQMELTTYNDVWQNYLRSNARLSTIMFSNFDTHYMPDASRLIYDLRFATAMTRIFYHRIKAPIPSCKDINAMWEYYKEYYNTSSGAAEKDSAIKKYYNFIMA